MTRRLVDVTRTLDRLAELLGDHPATADRFDRWLDDQENDMSDKDNASKPGDRLHQKVREASARAVAERFAREADVQTGIRLPVALISRADELARVIAAQDPVIGLMGPVTRSGVLRMALSIGLDELARRYGMTERLVIRATGEIVLLGRDQDPGEGELVDIVGTTPEALAKILERIDYSNRQRAR